VTTAPGSSGSATAPSSSTRDSTSTAASGVPDLLVEPPPGKAPQATAALLANGESAQAGEAAYDDCGSLATVRSFATLEPGGCCMRAGRVEDREGV
jgi:hypothetical protein